MKNTQRNQKRKILIGIAVLAAFFVAVVAIKFMTTKGPTDEREPIKGTYTMAEVAAARTTMKCWAVISDNVYDLTPFAAKNPALLPLCGTDATAAVKELGNASAATFTSLRIGSLNS